MRNGIFTHCAIAAALLLTGGWAHAQSVGGAAVHAAAGGENVDAQNGDWRSYRDAYRSMIPFEKFGKPKQFIQIHYRIVPRDKASTIDGVSLTLHSKSIELNMAIDAAGRAAFPLLKAAYDENAELIINRRPNLYDFTPQVSVIARPDGIYELSELHAACEQVFSYLESVAPSAVRGKKCVGVKFSYPRGGNDSPVKLRESQHAPTALPATEGGAFANDDAMPFKIITWRFAGAPEHGQIVTQSAPIAIAAIIE